MLVLGYANVTDVKAPAITVPPFHTGHLGFVPGTPVHVGLIAARKPGRHCEVVVTPFSQDSRYLATVSVVMRDEPGVVERLVAAVAMLGINIEVQESSSVKLLDNHLVSLLVDLSESSVSADEEFISQESRYGTPTAVRRLYRDYDSLFPVRDFRFVRLFESIVAHCAEIIEWKEISGEYLPDIDIQPYPDRPLATVGSKVLAPGDKPLHVKIDLPGGIAHRLKRQLGKSDQFAYLLASDTSTRALHAFFLHPDVTAQLFHVGFFHDDVPGALATILALLRDAQFNILTSLVRKQEEDEQEGRSIWEAVLEYRGKDEVPPSDSRPAHSPILQAELQWICDKIVAASQRSKSKSLDCGIDIAPPKYPVRPKGIEPAVAVPLSERLEPAPSGPDLERHGDLGELLAQRREALARQSDVTKGKARKTAQLIDLIERRNDEGEQPGIFLSYPGDAATHGQALEKRLSGHYRVDKYQEPDGEVIVEEVIRKIEGSDYFIGIWHHDEEPPKSRRTKDISPWMLFEYGVARAAEKPAIVVHSDKLDEDVWRRIDPGVANPEYSDFDFDPKTVQIIWEYCRRNFL